jgi:glutaredoxin-dependent peroxiredoxin
MAEIMAEIAARRAYRALKPEPIPRSDVELMIQAAHLAPSCFNYQPWRFVAVDDPNLLKQMHGMLGSTNPWMQHSPVIIAVSSHRDLDCKSSDNRDYFLFGCGMAVGFLMLQATRMGYVAHPVAGYKPLLVKPLLRIPLDYTLITLVNVGRHDADMTLLNDEQREQETGPRIRRPLESVLSWNEFRMPDTVKR